MKKILILLFVFYLNSCSSNNKIKPNIANTNTNNDKKIYKSIYNMLSNNLDGADEEFIKLKTDFENSPYLPKAALALAIAHMNKKEHILANFYLQELLQSNESNSLGKYLLSKNQYMYAKLVQNDQEYLNKAMKALETNKNLLIDDEYKLLSNTMLSRIKLDKIWNNIKIGTMYKKLNKNKAYELYINRTLNMDVDIKDIYKK